MCRTLKHTGVRLTHYSDNRWHSKYDDVYKPLLVNFNSLVTISKELVSKTISPASAPKILLMLTNPATSHHLNIELTCYVNALEWVRDFSLISEGDGQLAFSIGDTLRKMEEQIQGGVIDFDNLPVVNQLIADAVVWAASQPAVQRAELASANVRAARSWKSAAQVAAEVQAKRGQRRRLAPSTRPGAAALGERAAARAAARKVAQDARNQAEFEEQLQRALEDEAAAQAAAPPHTVAMWKEHLAEGLARAYEYMWTRFFVKDGPDNGQRYNNTRFFLAASLFTPEFASGGISLTASRILLEDLQLYPVITDLMLKGLNEELVSLRKDAAGLKKVDGCGNE